MIYLSINTMYLSLFSLFSGSFWSLLVVPRAPSLFAHGTDHIQCLGLYRVSWCQESVTCSVSFLFVAALFHQGVGAPCVASPS